jgi:hypothetical protein
MMKEMYGNSTMISRKGVLCIGGLKTCVLAGLGVQIGHRFKIIL